MSEITLNLEAYNRFIEKNRKLEEDVAKLNAIIKDKDRYIEKLEDNLEIVENANLYDRLIGWKQILSLITTE